MVVAPVARRAGRRPADQPREGEGVGLLALGHLRQWVLRLAWLAALGSHGDIMPDPGRVTRDRAPAPAPAQSSGPGGRILLGLTHEHSPRSGERHQPVVRSTRSVAGEFPSLGVEHCCSWNPRRQLRDVTNSGFYGAHQRTCRWGHQPRAILHGHPLGPEVAQQSVAPGFRRGARNTASRREVAVHGAEGPALLRFTGAVTCWCGDVAGVLAVASVPSAEPEILRRVTGVWG